MAYFRPHQLENSGIQGLSQFDPSPGLGFSVLDIVGNVGDVAKKLFGGKAQSVDPQFQAALAAQAAQTQKTQTYLLIGLGVLGLGLLFIATRQGRSAPVALNPFGSRRRLRRRRR